MQILAIIVSHLNPETSARTSQLLAAAHDFDHCSLSHTNEGGFNWLDKVFDSKCLYVEAAIGHNANSKVTC